MKKFLSDVLVDCNLTVSGTTSLGAATGITVASSDDSTKLATTAWVKNQGFVSTNTTYDISVPSGTTNIRLASSGGVNDDITISAAGASTVSRVSDSEIRITSTNSVDYVSNVALNGTILEFSGVGNGFAENVDLGSINTDTNYYLNSASFNTTNGVLTLGRQGLSNITVDLDNRYLTSESDTLDTVTSRDGVTTNTIGVGTVNVTGSTEGAELLTVDGTYGRLFTVTDDLSDSLFSVNTVAGLPAFEVFADNTIKIGAFANPITIDSSSNISIPGTITASGYNDSNWNTAFNDRITAAAVSGTSTKTLTLTQGDGSTITASWTDIEGTGADGYVSDVALNGNSLDFTAVGSGFAGSIDLSGITTDLTGYATEQYVLDNSDDYGSWNLKTNGVQRTTVQSGGNLDIVAGTNVSVSYGAGGVVTISSTDTNTDTNNYITGLAFNTANGVLTATRQGLGDLTVDLDGRYASSSHNHDSRYIRKDIVDSFTGLTNDTYDNTPGFLRGAISLRPGSAGGNTGIGFSTTVNVNTENGQDYGYVWWYDDNNNYAFGDGSGENAALILGIQNDSSTTDFGGTQDAVVLESSANIFFNPGLAGVGTGGVGGPDFTQGKVYIGRADEAYEVYHQGNLVNVSQLTNDAGYLTSFSETDTLASVTARGASTTTAVTFSGGLTASGGIDGLTNSNGISGNNFNISGVNEILINDPGEGIVWTSGASGNIRLYTVDDASDNILNVQGTNASLAVNGFKVATENWVTGRGYLTSETLTELSLASNILSYRDETGAVTELDLSLYLDDTNLARLTSGTLNGTTGIATFTRDDNSTFTVDFSAFLADANNYADAVSFNTSTGVLTIGRNGSLSDLTVDLDGRFALSNHTHNSFGGMVTFETNVSGNDDWENSPISIYERDGIGTGSTADIYAPNLNFHWRGVRSRSLWMSYNGDLHYGDYSTTGVPGNTGTFYVGGGNSGQWNTAYSWGDHSAAGYALSGHTHSAVDITSGTLDGARLPWIDNDTFNGTYPIVWSATDLLYRTSWLQVRGSDDTLLTRNISATGSITLTGAIGLAQAVNIDHGAGDGDAAGTVIETFDTGVFIGAFLDFTIYNDTKEHMRSGTLQLVFNADQVMFNEVNTMDIGDTTPCTLIAVNNGGSVEVVFTTPDPSFHIKYHVRTL